MTNQLSDAIIEDYRIRGQVLPLAQFHKLAGQGSDAVEAELERLRASRLRYTTEGIEKGIACRDMEDIHWCVEAAFVEHVPEYAEEARTLDPYLQTVVSEVIGAAWFTTAYVAASAPRLFIWNAEDEDSPLAADGAAGHAIWSQDHDGIDIHLAERTSALVALHEASHALLTSLYVVKGIGNHDEADDHDRNWRLVFGCLVVERYGVAAGVVFDRAVGGSSACTHGSQPPHEVAA